MTVIAFIGKPRTGKTLFMTQHAFSDYISGHKIFANYTLKPPFEYERKDVYEMLEIPFDDVERSPKTLLIQEADKIYDSWLRGSEQRLLSSLTGQSGKRNLNIYYDTQFPNRIQKSLRDVTEFVISSFAFLDKDKIPIAFQYTITELYEIENNPYYIPKKITIPAEILKPYYNMYDSYEVTEPISSNRERKEHER